MARGEHPLKTEPNQIFIRLIETELIEKSLPKIELKLIQFYNRIEL